MTHDTIEPNQDPATGLWRRLADGCMLRIWARDLERVQQNPFSRLDWSHVGHAVMIEHDDEDEVRALLPDLARETRMRLKVVDREDVVSGVGTWIESFRDESPTLVYLAQGRWSGGNSDAADAELPPESAHDEDAASRFRKTFADSLGSQIQDQPVVFVTTIRSIRQMDRSLRHQRGFDRRIKWPEIGDAVTGSVFLEETGESLFDASVRNQPAQVGAVVRKECPDRRRRSLLQQSLRRRSWRERRPLQLADILEFAIWGTAEEDAKPQTVAERRVHATHEAGHVVVSWLTSRECVAPVYCSATNRGGYLGVVVPPYDSHEQATDDMSYADAEHQIRVLLAGRAAEYLLLGADRISVAGASHDLKRATELAGTMFAKWGLSPDSTSPTAAASNLAVIVGEPSPTERAHVEGLVRSYLQNHFVGVLGLLDNERVLLERVVDALACKGVLFQSDLEALAASDPRRDISCARPISYASTAVD